MVLIFTERDVSISSNGTSSPSSIDSINHLVDLRTIRVATLIAIKLNNGYYRVLKDRLGSGGQLDEIEFKLKLRTHLDY